MIQSRQRSTLDFGYNWLDPLNSVEKEVGDILYRTMKPNLRLCKWMHLLWLMYKMCGI